MNSQDGGTQSSHFDALSRGPDIFVSGQPEFNKIGEAECDAWLLCVRGALDETVADAGIREDLSRAFARLADWMRNQPENRPDAR